MINSLSFQPLLPVFWLIVIVSISGLFVFVGLIMRRRGGFLRLLALAAIGLALLNPIKMEEQRVPIKSTVGVVIDRSQSQKIGQRQSDTDIALEQLKKELAKNPQIEPRFIEEKTIGASNDGTQTLLFSALAQGISDVPPAQYAGTIMITDGQVHDIPKTLSEASNNAPVNALITGRPDEFDRQIKLIDPPRFGITNKPLKLSILVEDKGKNPNPTQTAAVKIIIDGQAIANLTVPLNKAFAYEIKLPHAGKNIIEVSTPLIAGELTQLNNQTIAVTEAVKENLRVLLVSGEPHNGERTWRDLLKSDASIDLVHFTILRPPSKADNTPLNELSLIVFPTTELFVDKINDFDLVIFDRYQHYDVLPLIYYDYIAQYVQNGGALLMATGPEFVGPTSLAQTPLLSVLPALPSGEVIKKPFRPSLTKLGERHPVTRGLSDQKDAAKHWGRWLRQIAIDSSGNSTVLMNGADDKPLMLLDKVGKGRVGMLLSDEGWLWARGFEGGGPYASLYRRMAHWLMKEPELEEEALSAIGANNHLTIRRQTMQDKAENAEVTFPSGKIQTINLTKQQEGVFSATLDSDEIGLFKIKNGDKSAFAYIGALNAEEFSELISTPDKLKNIAQQTYGNVIRLHNSSKDDIKPIGIQYIKASAMNKNNFDKPLIHLREPDQTRLVNANQISIFSGLLALLACVLLLSSMWYREGR